MAGPRDIKWTCQRHTGEASVIILKASVQYLLLTATPCTMHFTWISFLISLNIPKCLALFWSPFYT